MTESPCKLAILVWAATPDRPELCAAPFVYAQAAAALDCEVEMHFAGPAVKFLVQGFADGVLSPGGKSIRAYMSETADMGVRFLACAMAYAEHIEPGAPLVPEFTGQAGATAFVARTLDPDWRTLVL